ncbi:MAG: hypothetical protein H6740_13600 [Alphaproteobacteria bacterium]|nr:hypothetical protein [Alphaproteobacteria bacterium]
MTGLNSKILLASLLSLGACVALADETRETSSTETRQDGTHEETAAETRGGDRLNCAVDGGEGQPAASPQWEVVARAAGGTVYLPAVAEDLAGCVYGGIVRGMWHANRGPVDGVGPQEVYEELRTRGIADPDIAWTMGQWNDEGGIDGGSAGDISDFKQLKDEVVRYYYEQGKIDLIRTSVINALPSAEEQTKTLKALAAKLEAGRTVEIDIAFSRTSKTGHFAFLLEIVKRGDDYGFTVADDRTQSNYTGSGAAEAETRPRGPFFINSTTGLCYFVDPSDGTEKDCPHRYWIRGALVEQKAGS